VVFRRVAQLGYAFPMLESDNLRGFIAVEEPSISDYTLVSGTEEPIGRYPTLIGRLHWADSHDWRYNSSLHVAGLLRAMGREDAGFEEDFEAGWGVSVMAKLRPGMADRHTCYLGGVVGEGIGNYMFGLSHDSGPTPADNKPAAGPTGGRLRALTNYGCHVGYSYAWNNCSATNFGYGYAYAESTADMPSTSARMLQNSWVNHQVKINDLVAMGLEYHYGTREVRDGTQGDNHRVLFVMQVLGS
jgi:hypothetical protein